MFQQDCVLRLAVCLAFVSGPIAVGHAQEPAPSAQDTVASTEADSPAYREAIEHGLAEYRAGNFAEARALFLRAHAISPNARTLRGLGIVEYELRNYAEAIVRLRQALASTVCVETI
jgi:Flp pilus assembly protein TadD